MEEEEDIFGVHSTLWYVMMRCWSLNKLILSFYLCKFCDSLTGNKYLFKYVIVLFNISSFLLILFYRKCHLFYFVKSVENVILIFKCNLYIF